MADSDRAIQQNATGDLVSVNASSVLAVGAEIVSLAGALTVTAVANTDALIFRGGATEYARLTSTGLIVGDTVALNGAGVSVYSAVALSAKAPNATDVTLAVLANSGGTRSIQWGTFGGSAATADGVAATESFVVGNNSTLVLGTVDGANPIRFISNEVEVARLTGTGLGIGKTPGVPLDVLGSIAASHIAAIQNSAASGYSGLQFYNSSSVSVGSMGWGNASVGIAGLQNALFTHVDGNNPLAWWINGSEQMRLTSTGLGIGCTPALPVDIKKSSAGDSVVGVQNSSATGYSSVRFFNNSGSGVGSIGWGNASADASLQNVYYLYAETDAPFVFRSNVAERGRWTSTGLGILNTAPSYPLDVTGVVRVNADGAAATPSLIVGLSETNTGLFKASDVLGLTVDATEAMRWGSSTQDRVLITGGTLADDKQAFKVTGTVNGSATGDQTGASFAITGGSANVTKYGLSVSLTGDTSGLCAAFVAAATSTAIGTAWYDGSTGNYGSELVATQTNGTGVNVGAFSRGGLSSIGNFGSVGVGLGSANTLPSCLNVGATGIVDSSFVDTFTQICIGVLAHMNDDAAPTSPESACIFADNVASANIPFIVAKSDSTLKFKVDANGGVLAQKVVTHKTSGYSVTAAESGTVFTNEGAAGSVTFTLPSAAKGLTYTFYVAESGQDLIIIPASGDTVRLAADVIDSAGDVTSSTEGRSLTLLAIDSTRWVGIANVGAWTFTA